MPKEKKAKSNLEVLQESEVLPKDMSLEEAVEELTDPLNCVECIVVDQCTDVYGQKTGENDEPGCKEAVRAYLKQDYIKKEPKEEL